MRIHITGASGSGTSTLGRAVASQLNWNFLDADDFFWLPTTPPYTTKRDPADRLEMLRNALSQKENVVLAGSIMGWGLEIEDSFDLIVFLYLEMSIRLERLKQREEKELGHIDPEFMQWASGYDNSTFPGRSLARHNAWLAERKSKIVRIEGDVSVEERCRQVLDALNSGQ